MIYYVLQKKFPTPTLISVRLDNLIPSIKTAVFVHQDTLMAFVKIVVFVYPDKRIHFIRIKSKKNTR